MRHNCPMEVEFTSGSAGSSDDTAPDERRLGNGNMGTFSSPQNRYPSQLLFSFPVPCSSIPLSQELGDYARDKAKSRKRQSRSSVNARKTEDKDDIRTMLEQLNEQMRKQSMQLTESNSEIRKQMGNLIESQNGQSKEMERLIESQNGQSKVLEKLIESQNGQSKELEKLTASINNYLRKQLEVDTNITGHAESDAPRSQMNQVPPPRYRLVFRSEPIDKIEKGKTIEISVAVVEAHSGRTIENGPLASATVELVVVNAEFNKENNQYDWSREAFESNIVKPRCENLAAGGANQSVKSIVSNGRFNLDRGVGCYSGSAIFQNSQNKKVRLAAMTVFPTEERVLEALSNPLLVRSGKHNGDVQSGKQSNLQHNSSNGQSNMHPNSSNGQRQAQGDKDYQEQNSSMPNLQQPSRPNSTQTGGIRSNIIGGQSQLPFLESSNMVSSEPFTSQEQQFSMQQYQSPHVPMVAQATYNQNVDDEAMLEEYLHRENTIHMGNDHVLGPAMDMQSPTISMPVQLVWDRPNVGPIKRDWNLLDEIMPLPKFSNFGLPTKRLMQEHLVYSRTIMSKEVMQARRNTGVIIEPLEPDDSDDKPQLKRKMHSKYQLRFVNNVCEGYHIMDPIKADDGSPLKVALFDGNRKITNGPLSSASVQIIVLHGDFNDHGQDYWTSEEFNCYEVCPRPGEEASSILGGDCVLVLSDGEACLGDAFFQMTSYCARTGKFKMGVRLASAQEERIQEGVSEPFWVKDRHCPGECELGIGPEDDTARINHPSVVQATMAELVTGPLPYTLKNKASSCRYIVMEGMEDVLDDGTFLHDSADAVEEADGKLKDIDERYRRYGLDGRVAMATPAATPSSSIDPCVGMVHGGTDASLLVGIDEAKDAIMKMLSCDDGVSTEETICIVGLAGVGKTTLVKMAYEQLREGYECAAFVPVGRNPDMVKVLWDILVDLDSYEFGHIDSTTRSADSLIRQLQEFLGDKRFLIVIDDVWDIQSRNIITEALTLNNIGSRIIITTRNSEVATGEVYQLQPLSEDNSKRLFYTRIFGGEDKCPNDLKVSEVAHRILRKCGGVPLAIITVASLLAGKSMEKWLEVCNSISFRDKDKGQLDDTMWILSLSYYDLPSHLKNCLLYLGCFPEDCLIEKDNLIQQWVAQGFVNGAPGAELCEVGEGYFNDLINRSLIQPVKGTKSRDIKGCRVHDMILDLIRSLFREEFAMVLDNHEGTYVRRLSRQRRVGDAPSFAVQSLNNLMHLRALSLEDCHPTPSFERIYLTISRQYGLKLPEGKRSNLPDFKFWNKEVETRKTEGLSHLMPPLKLFYRLRILEELAELRYLKRCLGQDTKRRKATVTGTATNSRLGRGDLAEEEDEDEENRRSLIFCTGTGDEDVTQSRRSDEKEDEEVMAPGEYI